MTALRRSWKTEDMFKFLEISLFPEKSVIWIQVWTNLVFGYMRGPCISFEIPGSWNLSDIQKVNFYSKRPANWIKSPVSAGVSIECKLKSRNPSSQEIFSFPSKSSCYPNTKNLMQISYSRTHEYKITLESEKSSFWCSSKPNRHLMNSKYHFLNMVEYNIWQLS